MIAEKFRREKISFVEYERIIAKNQGAPRKGAPRAQRQLFQFSDKSFGTYGECELEVKFTAGDKNKGEIYAEYVAVKGNGKISLSLENEYGGKVSATGKCGEKVRLPRALPGEEYTLKIKPADTSFRIEGISFGMRRNLYDD